MSFTDQLPYLGVGLVVGFAITFLFIKSKIAQTKDEENKRYQDLLETQKIKIKNDAKQESQQEVSKYKKEIEQEFSEKRTGLKELEKQIEKREALLEKRAEYIDSQEVENKKNQNRNKDIRNNLEKKQEELEKSIQEEKALLLKITGLKQEEAQNLLLAKIKDQVESQAARIIRENNEKISEESELYAQKVIGLAITRMASKVSAETTTSSVDLPSDDLKGKIIGREGRNIRAFEKATGVDLIVDDTPGVVILSSYDILRREVAKRSMYMLLKDGRIHPARIEEVVRQVEELLEKELIEIGTHTCHEMNLGKMHQKLRYYLGKMKYRTSYGQNMLEHSKEVADLCANMAGELKVDITLAKRAGLLHDIGKAADQEMEGTHPQIGAELAKKYDEHPLVINAIASHHEDVEMISVYSFLAMAADAISSARPGARRETSESYVKRLQDLEGIANSYDGVEQSFAIQAGREVRVLADATRITDDKALVLAKDIAGRIETELQYPGHVKVTVIRELRVEEFAK